ncbi:hypothetical protein [Streptomyces tsukubensis]|uniref:hypothetical protein n=1 Tax=Streptomyces tsukubensis TaxID=83656 RepID=UPI00344B6523
MHYLIHVFTEPGGSVEEAMEPFKEHDDGEELTGEWDWWVEGGRWPGYFDGENRTTAGAASGIETAFKAPYAYLTLDGRWLPREEYLPKGFQVHGRTEYLREVDGYERGYLEYLASAPGNTVVTAVDIHS